MIMIEALDKSEIEIDIKEVLRYLGYGKNDADEKTLKRIEDLTVELEKELAPKVCYEKYTVIREEKSISFGTVKTESKALGANLKDCGEVFVFVATIGVGIDRTIVKYSSLSPLDALLCQAIGTALIEEVCDKFCEKLKQTGFLKPRFSPGYGDFSIENQKAIFLMLDCPRKIGVTLTESMQMVPTKSVSAVVGISKEDTFCVQKGCGLCKKANCQYRR